MESSSQFLSNTGLQYSQSITPIPWNSLSGMTFATSCSTFIKCAVRFPSYHIKRKKKTIVYLNVGTYIQLHYLQVVIGTPKRGITILRSLLTDNPPSPGKVGHPTGVYVPSLFSNSGVGSFTFHKNQISESALRLDLWSLSLSIRRAGRREPWERGCGFSS